MPVSVLISGHRRPLKSERRDREGATVSERGAEPVLRATLRLFIDMGTAAYPTMNLFHAYCCRADLH